MFNTFLSRGHERCIGSLRGCGAHVAACRRPIRLPPIPSRPANFRPQRGACAAYKSLEIIAADARLIVECITGSRDRALASRLQLERDESRDPPEWKSIFDNWLESEFFFYLFILSKGKSRGGIGEERELSRRGLSVCMSALYEEVLIGRDR